MNNYCKIENPSHLIFEVWKTEFRGKEIYAVREHAPWHYGDVVFVGSKDDCEKNMLLFESRAKDVS